MNRIREMRNTNNPDLWAAALRHYWDFVKPSHMHLEIEMYQLNPDIVQLMNAEEWYEFLLKKYFRWKFTAPNRYATTTKMLKTYWDGGTVSLLFKIKEKPFAFDKDDIEYGLTIATSIEGLGTASASGLLAVLFPRHFGTVDQFDVKALSKIPELPEIDIIHAMNFPSLKMTDGVVLIKVMLRKASALNRILSTDRWTPR